MKIPKRLEPLYQAHLIDEVIGQLQSGKEAEVYVVRCGDEYRCAKVYKEANNRSFKNKTQYTEGRKVRNSRQARAMEKNSKYGREQQESEWQSTEVEALYLLAAAGVRVPKPYQFYEGVLLLEMISDAEGYAAPRLDDVTPTSEEALRYHKTLMREAVLMLCAGYIHGDFSQFNILVSSGGLVIIDFPQAVQATANSAFEVFERDLLQITTFLGRFAPEILTTNYPKEIWDYYKRGKLKPDTKLTGVFVDKTKKANIAEVMAEIDDARDEEMMKRGLKPRR